jgi:hypothetical protein
MLILIILFVLSFFFPPLWIGFGIYLVFYILTAKNRRKLHVENAILGLIRSGNTNTVNFQHLFFEPVQKYAIERGAEISYERSNPANNNMLFTLNVSGLDYLIGIHREQDGSASISARPEKEVMDQIRKQMGSF